MARRPTPKADAWRSMVRRLILPEAILSMNRMRDEDTVGKVKADSITSSLQVRSIEPATGMPWTYQVFGTKEIHRLNNQRIEHTERMVCRYQVRLVYSGRTQTHPSGLLVAEFWEQQMVGERDIDLEQRSALLDREER